MAQDDAKLACLVPLCLLGKNVIEVLLARSQVTSMRPGISVAAAPAGSPSIHVRLGAGSLGLDLRSRTYR